LQDAKYSRNSSRHVATGVCEQLIQTHVLPRCLPVPYVHVTLRMILSIDNSRY